MRTPSFFYLLIPVVAVGFLAACGPPEQTDPVDPAAPESAKLILSERPAPGLQIPVHPAEAHSALVLRPGGDELLIAKTGQAARHFSFEYHR